MIILRRQKEFGWTNAKMGTIAGAGIGLLSLPITLFFGLPTVLATIIILGGIGFIGGLISPDSAIYEKDLPKGPTTFKKQVEAIAKLNSPEIKKFIKDLSQKFPELGGIAKVIRDPKVKRPDWMESRDPKLELVIGALEPEEDFIPVLWIGGDADDGDYLGINPSLGKWVSMWDTQTPIPLKKYLLETYKRDIEELENIKDDLPRQYQESLYYLNSLMDSIKRNIK